jgi:MFS family permease
MLLLSVPFWGQVGRRYGLRKLLIVGFFLTGATGILAAILAGVPWLAASVLVLTAVGGAVIDGAGNVPFLRAVRPLERAEMTAVYSSWRHGGQLAAPGLFAIVLTVFPLPSVFVIGGAAALAMAFVSRYVPKRI